MYFTNNPHYVPPKTFSVGHEKTFQYVSILETFDKLFGNKNFRREYFNYNKNHRCEEGLYERYCCGRNYRENEFLQRNKNNIQIQIFFDDVQLTSPLKTKPHKVNAIYMIIRNFPPNLNSKLDNIYLVSLCDSEIVDNYGCNSILAQLVHDIKILETDGIVVGGEEEDTKICLKGTLVQASFDNLGGKTMFGFTKCFSASYYCRICICSKKMCRQKTIEVADKIRTVQQYNVEITKINESIGIKLKLKDTLGIAHYSVLNDLNFYHTIKNRSQDIMHDVYEGAMPLILRAFFQHLIEHRITTEMDIKEKINSYNYGLLERKNIPSKLCLKKMNLNQNASQMHCLMKHIPFIFVHLLQENEKSKRTIVHKAWPVIEYLHFKN